jgi:hypothetical protein
VSTYQPPRRSGSRSNRPPVACLGNRVPKAGACSDILVCPTRHRSAVAWPWLGRDRSGSRANTSRSRIGTDLLAHDRDEPIRLSRGAPRRQKRPSHETAGLEALVGDQGPLCRLGRRAAIPQIRSGAAPKADDALTKQPQNFGAPPASRATLDNAPHTSDEGGDQGRTRSRRASDRFWIARRSPPMRSAIGTRARFPFPILYCGTQR